MGLWDKVKAVTNKITGGGAKISLSFEGNAVKGPVVVHITAEIKDAPIEISKVYLKVKSVEEVTVPRSELPRNGGQSATFDLHLDREITPKTEFQVAEAQVLNAGQTYHWTYTVELPGNPTPTFLGHYVRHEWKFMAGLDAKGNDPDSGWQSVALY